MKKELKTINLLNLSLVFFLTVGTFTACKKKEDVRPDENLVEVKSSNGIAVFASYAEYLETMHKLDVASNEEKELWKKKQSYLTLHDLLDNQENSKIENISDLNEFNFNEGNLLILNKDGEFQFNDSIGWFHKGRLYYFPIAERESVRNNPSSCKYSDEAGRIPVVVKVGDSGLGNGRVDYTQMPNAAYNTKVYGPFSQGNFQWRFLLELHTWKQPVGVLSTGADFGISLESVTQYFQSNKWKTAGEQYYLNENLTATVKFTTLPHTLTTQQIVFNGMTSGRKGDLLKVFTAPKSQSGFWEVTVTGNYTHQFVGYTWNLVGYPEFPLW